MEHKYLGDLGALPDLFLDSSDDDDNDSVEIMRVSTQHIFSSSLPRLVPLSTFYFSSCQISSVNLRVLYVSTLQSAVECAQCYSKQSATSGGQSPASSYAEHASEGVLCLVGVK